MFSCREKWQLGYVAATCAAVFLQIFPITIPGWIDWDKSRQRNPRLELCLYILFHAGSLRFGALSRPHHHIQLPWLTGIASRWASPWIERKISTTAFRRASSSPDITMTLSWIASKGIGEAERLQLYRLVTWSFTPVMKLMLLVTPQTKASNLAARN